MKAVYKCPKCGTFTGKTGVYYAGTYAHKCPHCKQKVQLHVTGSSHWTISSTTATCK